MDKQFLAVLAMAAALSACADGSQNAASGRSVPSSAVEGLAQSTGDSTLKANAIDASNPNTDTAPTVESSAAAVIRAASQPVSTGNTTNTGAKATNVAASATTGSAGVHTSAGQNSATTPSLTQSALPAVGPLATAASSGGSTNPISSSPTPTPAPLPTPIPTPPPAVTAVTIVAGTPYLYRTTVGDPSGNTVTFSIVNCPSWAIFDTATGKLSGIPAPADVGTYAGIVITANITGNASPASSIQLSITVVQSANGTAEVRWTPPTEDVDGRPLSDLAGYRIYYGPNSVSMTQTLDVKDAGSTTAVVGNLSQGTWYFTVKAYTTSNIESAASTVANKVVL